MRSRGAGLGLAVVVSLAACGDDAGAEPDAMDTVAAPDASDATTASDTTSPSDALPDGAAIFAVSLVEGASAGVGGRVAFATAGRPYDEEGREALRVGACAFVEPVPPPFCDPACTIGTICLADDVCGAAPSPVGAGDITVTGLVTGLVLHPETQWQYYAPIFDAEPVDGELFADDATIRAVAAGDSVSAFDLTSRGVAPLDSPLPCPPTLDAGLPLTVTWIAASDPAARVRFELASGNHAAQFARIVCEGPDTGALTIDAAIIDRWRAAPRPFSFWRLARSRVGAAAAVGPAGPGRIELRVEATLDCRW